MESSSSEDNFVKEQRDYDGRFKVYSRMSVAQFDASLAILETHIKKKTTNFCELSVQGSLQCFLLQDEVDFGVRLYGSSKLSKHLSKCLLRMRKMQRIETDSIIFYDRRKFRRQCVNVIDITKSYLFFNVRIFQTQCAMALTVLSLAALRSTEHYLESQPQMREESSGNF